MNIQIQAFKQNQNAITFTELLTLADNFRIEKQNSKYDCAGLYIEYRKFSLSFLVEEFQRHLKDGSTMGVDVVLEAIKRKLKL